MQKIIVIGTDTEPVFSSVSLWQYGNISENSIFYVLDVDITNTLNVRIYIYKNSEEGKQMQEWLSHNEHRNNHSVYCKALEIFLSRITTDDFHKIIDDERKTAYSNGFKDAQRDIRNTIKNALDL